MRDVAEFRFAWILFVAVTCAAGAAWWIRGKKEMADHPELTESYRSLVRGLLIYGNLPWLVMGSGIVFGGVPGVLGFFNPRNGPFVMAWYVTVVALWILTAYWVFLRGGAETLSCHPGLPNLPTREPWVIKVLLVLTLAGGVVGLALIFLGYVRITT